MADLYGSQDVTIRNDDGSKIVDIVTVGGNNHLAGSIVQNAMISPGNSSTSNLGAGASFIGTGEATFGFAGIQINFKADQPCTLYVDQSIDNVNWDITDSWIRAANESSGRIFQVVASYFRVRVTNNGSSATTYLRLQSILCPIIEALPRALSSTGRLLVDSVTGIDTTKKILELIVDRTDAIVAGTMRQAGTRFTIPAGYIAQVTGIIAYASDNKSNLIVGKLLTLGTYNSGTGIWTAGSSYSSPLFASTIFLEVISAMGNVNDQNYTVSYTNQNGVAGRTATSTVKLLKNSGVGVIIPFNLQAGDYGVRSVQSVTPDKANTGIININGMIQFCDYSIDVANASRVINTSDYWYIQAEETIALDVGISKPGAGATAERQINVILTLTSA